MCKYTAASPLPKVTINHTGSCNEPTSVNISIYDANVTEIDKVE